MNLELYKIILTIGVLLLFVAGTYLVEAYHAKRIDRVETACVGVVVFCVIVLGVLVWTSYASRIA